MPGSHHDIDCAFAAIEKAHRLMSFHDPTSDVARMNRTLPIGRSKFIHGHGGF